MSGQELLFTELKKHEITEFDASDESAKLKMINRINPTILSNIDADRMELELSRWLLLTKDDKITVINIDGIKSLIGGVVYYMDEKVALNNAIEGMISIVKAQLQESHTYINL